MTVFPNLIVPGVARSGSTWLYECFKESPEFSVPKVKEVNYFNRDAAYERGDDWYASQFMAAHNTQIVADVTPTYFCCPIAIKRMYALVPEARVLVVLRDPRYRAYSAYLGYVQKGLIPEKASVMDSHKFLKFDNQPGILEHGHYAEYLENLFSYFDPSQVLIKYFDELQSDPRLFLSEVFNFCDVVGAGLPSCVDNVVNESRYSRVVRGLHVATNRILPESFRSYGHGLAIRARRKFAPRFSGIPRSELARLTEYYVRHIERVENMLNKNLGDWKH
jgi:hypothetical protein